MSISLSSTAPSITSGVSNTASLSLSSTGMQPSFGTRASVANNNLPSLYCGIASDVWPGSGKLLEFRRSYAPVVDSNGIPLADCVPGSQSNRYCEFETIMYSSIVNNRATPRPSHISQRRWEQAERDNPDAEHLEPIVEIGVCSLKKRYESQQAEKVRLRAYTDELTQAIGLLNRTSTKVMLKYEDLSSKHAHLFNKLLRLLMKIELVRCHGAPIAHNEHRFRERLEKLSSLLHVPYAKLQELISIQKSEQDYQHKDLCVLTNTDREHVAIALERQREGLQQLTEILMKDLRDMEIMRKHVLNLHGV